MCMPKIQWEVECITAIVAMLQAWMATKRLWARVEQIQKAKKLDKWKDGRDGAAEEKKRIWSLVLRDGRFMPAGVQMHLTQRVKWVAERTGFLQPMDTSLEMWEISTYVFGHEVERFLYPLLGARGLEAVAMQRLVRILTRDWKLMVTPMVCEYILTMPVVRVKGHSVVYRKATHRSDAFDGGD